MQTQIFIPVSYRGDIDRQYSIGNAIQIGFRFWTARSGSSFKAAIWICLKPYNDHKLCYKSTLEALIQWKEAYHASDNSALSSHEIDQI